MDTVRKSRILVLGRGASGKAAAALAEADGAEVAFADGCDLVVASPGMHVMSELEFGCRRLKAQGARLLAVTGSKGKSSVVKAVADALTLAGRRAVPCGNFGLPVSELARQAGDEADPAGLWAVVEVSSFMLETTNLPPDTFEAAAILNLQEDHLDRHGCVEVYHALKRRLAQFAKQMVACDEGGAEAILSGSYFDNRVLRANGCCAVGLLRAAGLDDAAIARGLRSFVPLPHRFEAVGERNGVRYIDDSKATSIAALMAGVEMAGSRVRLIAGGKPKGDDPKIACELLTNRAKKVYLIGQGAELFHLAWKDAVDCEVCGTLERAVEAATREAVKGETVLLSPGAASFDQFKDFEQRGEHFATLVKKEGQKKR